MINKKPYLLDFGSIGDDETGYHSYAEYATTLPFEPKRIYWVYNTPEDLSRGNVANVDTKTVFVALTGKVKFHLEDAYGKSFDFELSSPSEGLFSPEKIWRRITMEKGSILLCFASNKFDEKDNLRDFREFKKVVKRR